MNKKTLVPGKKLYIEMCKITFQLGKKLNKKEMKSLIRLCEINQTLEQYKTSKKLISDEIINKK